MELEKQNVVLHVVVVGFHHKRGCQIDFSFPPFFEDKGSESRDLPSPWKHLPCLALPDGAHNYEQDSIYFHLPGLVDVKNTVFGVSCYKQINSRELVNKSDDVTRGTVQKSVVVLSTLPLYGLIHAKLQPITHAYFDQKDFTRVEILQEFYENLNSSLPQKMPPPGDAQMFIGLSLIDLIKVFKHKILIIFKLMLLERRVLFFGAPVHHLCNTVLTMVSLFPEMIDKGLIDAACPRYYKAKTPNFELRDFGIHTDDYFEVDSSSLPNYKRQTSAPDNIGGKTTSLPRAYPQTEKLTRIANQRKERARQLEEIENEINGVKEARKTEDGFDDIFLGEKDVTPSQNPADILDLENGQRLSDENVIPHVAEFERTEETVTDSSDRLKDSVGGNGDGMTEKINDCSERLTEGGNGTLDNSEESEIDLLDKDKRFEELTNTSKLGANNNSNSKNPSHRSDSSYTVEEKKQLNKPEDAEEDELLDLIDQELFGPYFEEKKERTKHNSGKDSTHSDSSTDKSHDQSAILDLTETEGIESRKDSGYSSNQNIHERKDGDDKTRSTSSESGMPSNKLKLNLTNIQRSHSAEPRPTSTDSFEVVPSVPSTPVVDVDDFGFPLALFGKGALCHPYMALQQHDLLQEVSVRCFIVGASNILFKHKRHILDVIIEFDNANLAIYDPELRKQLQLSTADLRFADYVVNTVLDRNDDEYADNTGWEGGEAWVRAQFRLYLLSLLATCADNRPRAEETWGDFNENFLDAWRTTHNYRIWKSKSHNGLEEVHTRHVCHGQLSMNDMKIRLNSAMQTTERGKKLNVALNRTSEALTNAKSVVSSWFFGFLPDEWSDEED